MNYKMRLLLIALCTTRVAADSLCSDGSAVDTKTGCCGSGSERKGCPPCSFYEAISMSGDSTTCTCGGGGATAVIDTRCGVAETCNAFAPPNKQKTGYLLTVSKCTECSGQNSGDDAWVCWPSVEIMHECSAYKNMISGAVPGIAVDGLYTCSANNTASLAPTLFGILAMFGVFMSAM